jgi:S1-C subfamily serine protease
MRAFLLFLFLLAVVPASATDDEKPTPQILDAVVKLKSQVPREARTAPYLGTEREGSGVLIDAEGLIVTIGYLITEAMSVEVETAGKRATAKVIGFDMESGLGLVRTEQPLGVKPIQLGRSRDATEKSPVLVASFGGAESAIGAQVVSRRTFAGYWEYLLEEAIFTSPPHGNWGGAALIGRDGKLLGIGSLMVPNAGKVPGGGEDKDLPGNMFVPIDKLKPVMADLLSGGRPSGPPRPWLGIRTVEHPSGLVVMSVQPGSPAEKAGVERGDIITRLGGEKVTELGDLYRKLWAKGPAGVEVPLTLLDKRGPREVKVQTMDRYKFLKLDLTY